MKPLHPFTAEWASAFREAINDDPGYREAARGWAWSVAFVLNATPLLRAPRDIAAEFVLHNGSCVEARVLHATNITAPFVFRADYSVWRSMAHGTLDPVLAVAQRKISLTGSLTELLLHARAARALVACAQRVPTWFPDES